MRLQKERRGTQQAGFEALLGQDGIRRFREYQKTVPARRQVEEFQTALAAASLPLSEAQKQTLLTSMVTELRNPVQPPRANPSDARGQLEVARLRLEATEERNRRVLDGAQGYLSARQLDIVREAIERPVSMSRATLRLQGAQLEREQQ
jgi:hypothetical protein